MLQSICDWRIRMAEALQDTNHYFQGLNFLSQENLYVANMLLISK